MDVGCDCECEVQQVDEAFSDYYASQWEAAGVNIAEHQAILPLPFALVGSEKIGLEMGRVSSEHAMIGSFSSGLPIVGGAMSRTSLDVTEKSAQLISDSLLPRPILDDFIQDKKILILQSNEPLTIEEKRLISNAEKVFECNDYQLYSTSVENIRSLYASVSSLPDSVAYAANSGYLVPKQFIGYDEDLWGAPSYEMNKLDHLLDTVFPLSETLTISYNPNLLDNWLLVSEDIETEAGKQHDYVIHARGGIISRIQLRKKGVSILHQEGERKFLNNVPVGKPLPQQ